MQTDPDLAAAGRAGLDTYQAACRDHLTIAASNEAVARAVLDRLGLELDADTNRMHLTIMEKRASDLEARNARLLAALKLIEEAADEGLGTIFDIRKVRGLRDYLRAIRDTARQAQATTEEGSE